MHQLLEVVTEKILGSLAYWVKISGVTFKSLSSMSLLGSEMPGNILLQGLLTEASHNWSLCPSFTKHCSVFMSPFWTSVTVTSKHHVLGGPTYHEDSQVGQMALEGPIGEDWQLWWLRRVEGTKQS